MVNYGSVDSGNRHDSYCVSDDFWMNQEPYILEEEVIIHKRYNHNYGANRLCICGHVYYRHFDSYENMLAIGCKYCPCYEFKEFAGEFSVIDMFVKENSPKRYKELLAKRHQAVEFHTMELSNAQAQKTFNEDLLEEHYRLTQIILNPLMGINSATDDVVDGHPQDILED